jgi:hypothetical protein
MALNEECSRAREWTSRELDSSLSRFESAGLRRHLRSCADCRAFAADVRGATSLIRATPLLERRSPVGIPAGAGGRTRRTGVRLGAAAAVVASMAALVAGGLSSGLTRPSGGATQASAGGDLSSMRAIRRQQLASATAADTPRIRVIEID